MAQRIVDPKLMQYVVFVHKVVAVRDRSDFVGPLVHVTYVTLANIPGWFQFSRSICRNPISDADHPLSMDGYSCSSFRRRQNQKKEMEKTYLYMC